MEKKLFRLDMRIEEDLYDAMLGLLSLHAQFGWQEKSLPTGETIFTIHCGEREYLENLARMAQAINPEIICTHAETDERDWVHAWKEFFTPVKCGSRFVILPPWHNHLDFDGRTKVIINPKSAFGTGHHASTTLCMQAISDLLDAGILAPGHSFLDLGCGSGVLGLAAVKSGLNGLGVDMDELAITNASENRRLNDAENLELMLGGIEVCGSRKFDFIVANILAGPLIELAPEICAHLKPGGKLVLCGILDVQAEKVEKAYRGYGQPAARHLSDGEWRALIWDGAADNASC